MNAKTKENLRKEWAFFLAIFGGFILRALLTAEHAPHPLFSFLRLDEIQYDAFGVAAAQGHWFPGYVPTNAPGYSWFLGIVYSCFGRDLLAVRAIQAGLGIASAGLVYVTAREVFGRFAAGVSCFLILFYWPLLIFEQRLLAVCLFLFLNLAGLSALVFGVKKNAPSRLAWSGLFFGLSVLVRPTALLPAALLGGWILFIALREKSKRYVAGFMGFCLAGAAVVLPVIMKMHERTGEWAFLQRNGGLNFYLGNNPESDGAPYARPGGRWDRLQSLVAEDEEAMTATAEDRFYMRLAFQFARENPGSFIKLQFRKLLLLLNDYEVQATISPEFHRGLFRALSIPLPGFGVILAFSLPGFLMIKRKDKAQDALLLFTGGHGLSVIATVVSSRYRIPFVAGLCFFAGLGALALWEHVASPLIKRESGENRGAKTAALLIALFLSGFAVSLLPLGRNESAIQSEEYAYLGEAWLNRGNFVEAKKCFYKALEKGGSDWMAYRGLARLAMEAGMREEAILFLRRAVEADPGSSLAHYQLGRLLWQSGAREQALSELRAAVKVRPRWVRGLLTLAQLEAETGDKDAARGRLLEVLRLRPDLEEARVLLSRLGPLEKGKAR